MFAYTDKKKKEKKILYIIWLWQTTNFRISDNWPLDNRASMKTGQKKFLHGKEESHL